MKYSINRIFSRLLPATALTLLFPVIFFGQSRSTSYGGMVYDNVTKQPLAQVRITATNLDSNKIISNTTSNNDGSYIVYMTGIANIKITASLSGYAEKEFRYTREQLKSFERTLPPIYMDTVIKIPKPVPVIQKREEYLEQKLTAIDVLPSPSSYRLLYYLNPGLEEKTTLMSNENIILPTLPKASSDIKKENKGQFKTAKSMDKSSQGRLRDTIDKVYNILSDNMANYKIDYRGVVPDSLKQMRIYLLMDINAAREKVKSTSRLQAEELTRLLSSIGNRFQKIISKKMISGDDFLQLKMFWEDLSYMISGSHYQMFLQKKNNWSTEHNTRYSPASSKKMAGPSPEDEADQIENEMVPGFIVIEPSRETSKAGLYEDRVASFGFIIWAKEIAKFKDLSVPELADRYIVSYAKPAYMNDKDAFTSCNRRANVAIAILTRAKYGVKVYDKKEEKYLDVMEPVFDTGVRFMNRAYDNIFIPDHKDLTYIIIELK